MDMNKFYSKMESAENVSKSIGHGFGTLLGKIIKNPFKFLWIMLSFIFISIIVFLYSVKDGFKKS